MLLVNLYTCSKQAKQPGLAFAFGSSRGPISHSFFIQLNIVELPVYHVEYHAHLCYKLLHLSQVAAGQRELKAVTNLSSLSVLFPETVI